MITRRGFGDPHAYRAGGFGKRAEKIFVRPIVADAENEFGGSEPEPFESRSAFVDAGVADLNDLVAFENLHVNVARVSREVIDQFLRALRGLFRVGFAIMPRERE